jgi:hypothetical protein
MHLTLKLEIANPPAISLQAQQRRTKQCSRSAAKPSTPLSRTRTTTSTRTSVRSSTAQS